jgi:hypothetical protein
VSDERQLLSWGAVLGLSSGTIDLAERLLKEIRGRKVYSIKKALLAIYVASMLRGEYVPLSVLVRDKRIAPAIIRVDIKRLFGVNVDAVRVAEIESRGWCRILQLDPLLCEATTCIVVEVVKNEYMCRLDYTMLVMHVLRYVAKRLGLVIRIPSGIVSHHYKPQLVLYRKRVKKYADACVERATQLTAMQPP